MNELIVFVIMSVPYNTTSTLVVKGQEEFKHKEVCEMRASTLNRYSLYRKYYCVDSKAICLVTNTKNTPILEISVGAMTDKCLEINNV